MSENELSKSYEPSEVEARWYPIWMERGYFHAEANSAKPPYCIVLPPPNVTGSLHLGHALTATLQDTLIRWRRMSGYNCLWLPGTDHAGIATQMVVERELKKTEGKSRHDLGRDAFIERVWKWKHQYGQRIGEQHRTLGASLDWERERFTMDEGVSVAVKEVFVRLFEEGLIYRAQKLINWCPSCRTALSDLEVEHEEKDGSLWHIRYAVTGTDRTLTVATTRPETILGDTAVAIHPDDERYKDLVGKTVTLPLVGREIPIVLDAELVNPEFGTGVVKVTPAHDFNDYQTGLRHKLPMISIFDDSAVGNENAGRFQGVERFEMRKAVLAALTEEGLLEKEEPHKLSIGQCSRCSTVVEPRLSPQWFVKIEPLAKPAIEAVEQGRTRFVPETWTQTFFQWMNNIHDWCISRQLWWGHQIPAYYCADCSPKMPSGALDYENASPVVAREKPESCASCGSGNLVQDPDVLDTWFSSGLWPFSTLGWPEQTPELKAFYPNAVMETGHDIIFFWVARMMMMGLHFMKDVPFKTVYLHAMVRDEKGEKMSKTKGNVIDPLDIALGATPDQLNASLRNKFPQGMPAHGADALRFTLAALTQQGRDIKISIDRVGGYKAFTNKLWNASRFVLMNMGDFRPNGTFVADLPLTLADRWILSRLNRAIADTGPALEEFQFATAANTLYQFLWYELCDWYIELAKPALYGDDEERKNTTRAVLVHALDQVLRALHPFMPFITEEIWQKLPITHPADSIMLASYPSADPRIQDDEAEREMQPLIEAIEGIRNLRGESNLPPSSKLVAHVYSDDAFVRDMLGRWNGYLLPLAGLSAVHVHQSGNKPGASAVHVGPRMEIHVPLAGLIDLDEERARLQKELTKCLADMSSVKRKLDNPSFVERAPAEVVEKDRARVAELAERQQKLEENLRRLAPGAEVSEPASTEQHTEDRTMNTNEQQYENEEEEEQELESEKKSVLPTVSGNVEPLLGGGQKLSGASVVTHAVEAAKAAAERVREAAVTLQEDAVEKVQETVTQIKRATAKKKPAKAKAAKKPATKTTVKAKAKAGAKKVAQAVAKLKSAAKKAVSKKKPVAKKKPAPAKGKAKKAVAKKSAKKPVKAKKK